MTKDKGPYWRKNVGRACVQRLLVPNLATMTKGKGTSTQQHSSGAAHLRQYNFVQRLLVPEPAERQRHKYPAAQFQRCTLAPVYFLPKLQALHQCTFRYLDPA